MPLGRVRTPLLPVLAALGIGPKTLLFHGDNILAALEDHLSHLGRSGYGVRWRRVYRAGPASVDAG